MDISKLAVGMEFKNYKTICEFLGEPIKSGGAKQNQLEQWGQYFIWHKVGNAFIIDSINIKKRRKGNRKVVKKLHCPDVIEYKERGNSITLTQCKNLTTFEMEIDNTKARKGIKVKIRKAPWRKTDTDTEKRETTDPPEYYENETDDQIFDNIMANKRNLKLFHYYSYKKLCEILNIPYAPKGGSKERILSFIEQQVYLLRENNKYKVLRIYKTALPRPIVSKNNATVYGDMLCFALVKYLSENPDQLEFLNKHNYLYFSRNFLAQEMYLCNEKFNEFKTNAKRKELSEQTNIPIDNINDFYFHTDRQMKSAVKKGLKNLQGRRTIRFNDSESSIVISFTNGYKRLATYEEIGLITEAEKTVKKKLKIDNLSSLIMNGTIGEFYKAVEIYIREQAKVNHKYQTLAYLDYYYKAVTIFCTIKCLEMGFEEFIDNIEDSLRITNDIFISENMNYYSDKKDLDKAIDTVVVPKGFGEVARTNKEKELIKLKYEYLQSIYLLYEILVKKKPPLGAYREVNEYGNKIKE